MNIIEYAIGWLAPPQCIGCGIEGFCLCEACSTSEIVPYGEHCFDCGARSDGAKTCPKCSHGGAPRFVWITSNYEGLAKQIIQQLKFGSVRACAKDIAFLMCETYKDFALNPGDNPKYIVVPVPTATQRVRHRGFDHSQLLAKQISEQLNIKLTPALGRIGQTRQVGSKRTDRIKQAKDKYYVKHPSLVADQNILLIDDVTTTGATLRSAAKTLRKMGAKRVDALVFAKRL